MQVNDKSIEKINKIESNSMRDHYEVWLTEAGLSVNEIHGEPRRGLLVALQSVNETHVARTIQSFADFVLLIAQIYDKDGETTPNAVDKALPALRLPRNSGEFNNISPTRRRDVKVWNDRFRSLHRDIRPFLFRQDQKGENIDSQIRQSMEDRRSILSDHEYKTILEFCNSNIVIDDWSIDQQILQNLTG